MLLNHRSIAGLCALFMLCFCGITGHMLWELRQQTWSSALREADNLLAALSQDIARNIEIYDLSLLAVVDGLRIQGVQDVGPEMRHAILFDRAATAKYLGSILLLDEAGRVTDDAGSVPPRQDTFSDREYFKVHRDTPGLGLYLSAPFRRRLTGPGDLVIAFSRRIDKPDGSFGGVVVGTLRLDYVRSLFERVALGDRGAVTLLRTDGTIMMRAPYDEPVIGQSVAGTVGLARFLSEAKGRYTGPSSVDGVPRTFSFAHIESLPLILSVALSEADVLAVWTGRAAVIAGLLVVVCLAGAGLSLRFATELRRRFRAESEMRASEAQLRLLADHATDVIIRLDATLTRRYVSPSCRAVLGYRPDELIGRQVPDTAHPEDRRELLARVAEARRQQGHVTVTYRVRHRDGTYVWVESQYAYMVENGGFTVLLRDVGRRKQAEAELAAAHAELARIAMTDGLTNLANRRRFDQAIAQEWSRAAREETPLTLLLLDVDHFKRFNDRYGHHEGDACLRAVADALAGCTRRPADLVCRYGGEEFAVLLPGVAEDQAAGLAETLREAVAALCLPHDGNEAAGIVTISLGVATALPQPVPHFDDPAPDIAAFIVAADRQLYAAKKAGRNRVSSLRCAPDMTRLLLART